MLACIMQVSEMVATVAAGTSAEYYIASSDYYIGGSEPAGRWVAVGVEIGVVVGAIVERDPFERLHAALDLTGRPMLSSRSGKKHVGGYDITFSAPKTCSILWALADPELRAKIEEAQANAFEVALKAIEANAAFCRFGKDGVRRQKVKLSVAVFQHGAARPARHRDGKTFSDCALHSHAVTFNIARKYDESSDRRVDDEANQTEQKRHGALDGKAIFAWKMAAGAVYHAQLSKNFQNLGFAVGDIGKNGIWEVVGIVPQLKSYFSARRGEIEEALDAAGTDRACAPHWPPQLPKRPVRLNRSNTTTASHSGSNVPAISALIATPSLTLALPRVASSVHRLRIPIVSDCSKGVSRLCRIGLLSMTAPSNAGISTPQ